MIDILEARTYFNRFGTRKTRVKFQGDYTQEDIETKLATDAPYGYWYKFDCIDEDNRIYKGEIHEYWD